MTDYEKMVKNSNRQFEKMVNIHELPAIFHYWSNKYLLPKLTDVFSVETIPDFFVKDALFQLSEKENKILSIGSGDVSLEISIAKLLLEKGHGFLFECRDLSPDLCARGRLNIQKEGLQEFFSIIECDLNKVELEPCCFDLIIANHSLHHILKLEHVFGQINKALKPTGYFVTNDMIGRNGHMRWEESLTWVNAFWSGLSEDKKYNHQLKRVEHKYVNWDCSVEGFEGIRAQDILPLLIENFNFSAFLGFGGITDPFIDRCFGHNFDMENPLDVRLIDTIEMLNSNLLEIGFVKPTQILAVMKRKSAPSPGCKYYKNLSPEFCVRHV